MSAATERHDVRGVYIIEINGDGMITGHFVSIKNGRRTVQAFTRCTRAQVMEHAGRVIHEPKVYRLQPSAVEVPSMTYTERDPVLGDRQWSMNDCATCGGSGSVNVRARWVFRGIGPTTYGPWTADTDSM